MWTTERWSQLNLRIVWLYCVMQWLYSPSEALDSPYIPQNVKEQIQSWEFEREEKIRTDHYDFISLETYGYTASPFRTRIEITGMGVTNDQVVTERSKRTVAPDGTAYTGVTIRVGFRYVCPRALIMRERCGVHG